MSDNKINFRIYEREIAKNLCKVYRDITGRGPINTEARVVNKSIFIEFRTEYLTFERLLFDFIRSNNQESDFFNYIKSSLTTAINIFLKKCNQFLIVVEINCSVNDDATYMLVTMNKNLEKMLVTGEAKLPHVNEG